MEPEESMQMMMLVRCFFILIGIGFLLFLLVVGRQLGPLPFDKGPSLFGFT